MSDWQPIETAPRDGEWVLFYVPSKFIPKSKSFVLSVGPRVIAGRWVAEPPDMNGYTPSKHLMTLKENHGGYWSANARGIKPLHGLPTHWMPLPEPPQ